MANTKFARKNVGSTHTIGEELRAARVARRLRIADVEERLKIQAHYLEAFEADRFDGLPDLYLRGLLGSYAELLGLNSQKIVRSVLSARKLETAKRAPAPKKKRLPRQVVTPRRLAWALGLLLIAVSLPFVGREFAVWAKPPEIALDPVFYDDHGGATLKGHLDPESRLWADGIEVGVSDSGNFSLHLLLPPGSNRVDFLTKNRFGKTAVSSKVLSVYPPQPSSSTDPVALRVEITHRPTWLTIRSGTSALFDGVATPGAGAVFYGRDLTLSTSDAGATSASVSNSVVQAKDLGLLGSDHERLQNIRFQADTAVE